MSSIERLEEAVEACDPAVRRELADQLDAVVEEGLMNLRSIHEGDAGEAHGLLRRFAEFLRE